MASEPTLTPEDLALLDRLAARVVELRMEVPAILALESGKPLSLLAGQAMIFFEPFVQALFSFPDYRRFAALIERRETIEALLVRIENESDRVQAERRARRKTPPSATGPA
jgi:hypothetical protein